jgi:predicted phage baseplate assembly protein
VGNGVAGNVGACALAHAVTSVTAVTGICNPLPAAGGVDPETAEQVRRDAPSAFMVQEGAVTAADYEDVAARSGRVQRAAATFRWTGSWHTVFVTADRPSGAAVDEPFERDLRGWLERYRMAGYDLEVDGPVPVPLEIGLHVCVPAGHFRADVGEAVRAALSDRVLPDGRRGLFHPGNRTFGQPVYLSAVQAAVHAVPGVESVDVHTFQRQRDPASSGLADGVLPMGRLEIALLDDDPNHPERGVLAITLGGGT